MVASDDGLCFGKNHRALKLSYFALGQAVSSGSCPAVTFRMSTTEMPHAGKDSARSQQDSPLWPIYLKWISLTHFFECCFCPGSAEDGTRGSEHQRTPGGEFCRTRGALECAQKSPPALQDTAGAIPEISRQKHMNCGCS